MDFKAYTVLKALYARKTNKLKILSYTSKKYFLKPLFKILIWLKSYSGQVNFFIPKLFIKIVRHNVQIRLLITFA